jgi:hypothetical protein
MAKFYSVIGYAIQEEIARAQLVGDGRSPASIINEEVYINAF